MSRITVAEKQHWKERISARIDRAIDKLWSDYPQRKQELEDKLQEAVEAKYPTLPFDEHRNVGQQLQQLEEEQTRLEEAQRELARQILAGLNVRNVKSYNIVGRLQIELKRLKDTERVSVFANDDVGRKVTELEREKDELLDTVWLATSSHQVKELWKRFARVVNDEPTKMQEEALDIPPVEPETE